MARSRRRLALGGPASTFAFTTAYLGDVAFASLIDDPPGDGSAGQLQAGRAGSVRPGFSPGGAGNDGTGDGGGSAEPGAGGDDGGGVQLRVQRHHADRFAAPTLLGTTGAESVLRADTHGRARLPLGRARRVVCAGLALRSRAAGLRRTAARSATWPRPSPGRADRGRAQRRRSRDRRLERSSRRADQRLCQPLTAWRSLHGAAAARRISRPPGPTRLRGLAAPRAPLLGERDARLDGRCGRPLGDSRGGDRHARRASRRHDLASGPGRAARRPRARTGRRSARAVDRTAADRRGVGPRLAGDLRRAGVRRLPGWDGVRRG